MAALNRLFLFLNDFIRVTLNDVQREYGLPLDGKSHALLDFFTILFCLIKEFFALVEIQIEFPSHNYVLFVSVLLYLFEKWVLSPILVFSEEGRRYWLRVLNGPRNRFAPRALHVQAGTLLR